MFQSSFMRRIVDTHSHSRESQSVEMAMFLSPKWVDYKDAQQGLYRPHTGKATVTRTGTLPPSSCGKGPTAVGESVMMLPGNPPRDAARLTVKGRDLSGRGQSRYSSQRTGKPSTGQRAAVQGTVRMGLTWGSSPSLEWQTARPATQERSVCKDSLGGKAGCGESRLSGLEGGSRKPGSRKTEKALSFYPYTGAR